MKPVLPNWWSCSWEWVSMQAARFNVDPWLVGGDYDGFGGEW